MLWALPLRWSQLFQHQVHLESFILHPFCPWLYACPLTLWAKQISATFLQLFLFQLLFFQSNLVYQKSVYWLHFFLYCPLISIIIIHRQVLGITMKLSSVKFNINITIIMVIVINVNIIKSIRITLELYGINFLIVAMIMVTVIIINFI